MATRCSLEIYLVGTPPGNRLLYLFNTLAGLQAEGLCPSPLHPAYTWTLRSTNNSDRRLGWFHVVDSFWRVSGLLDALDFR